MLRSTPTASGHTEALCAPVVRVPRALVSLFPLLLEAFVAPVALPFSRILLRVLLTSDPLCAPPSQFPSTLDPLSQTPDPLPLFQVSEVLVQFSTQYISSSHTSTAFPTTSPRQTKQLLRCPGNTSTSTTTAHVRGTNPVRKRRREKKIGEPSLSQTTLPSLRWKPSTCPHCCHHVWRGVYRAANQTTGK